MRSGRILLALLLLIGSVGAVFIGTAIYSRFLFLGVFLAILSWVWTRWAARGLQVSRSSRVLRANVGDIVEEKFEVMNNSFILAPWIEILNQSTVPFAAGSRLFTFVTRRQQRSYLARTYLTRRGGFPLGPTRISTGDPFGFFHASKEFSPI